jgi:hypothetical protein
LVPVGDALGTLRQLRSACLFSRCSFAMRVVAALRPWSMRMPMEYRELEIGGSL